MNLLNLVGPRLNNIYQIRRKWYYSSGSIFLQSKRAPSWRVGAARTLNRSLRPSVADKPTSEMGTHQTPASGLWQRAKQPRGAASCPRCPASTAGVRCSHLGVLAVPTRRFPLAVDSLHSSHTRPAGQVSSSSPGPKVLASGHSSRSWSSKFFLERVPPRNNSSATASASFHT